VLELGVGTGRLAIPLAERGLAVTGVDASATMLEHLAAKPGGGQVAAVLGDMADPPVGDAAFAVVFVAYNTLFNLVADGAQQRCLASAAALLAPGGAVVVEAFVPDEDGSASDAVTTRRVTADQVVLSVSRSDPARQEALGQYVDITEAGIKLRPWHIRWSTPEQIDEMAAGAGLALEHRWADWAGTAWSGDAPAHVSVYRRTA
jgi:SAM-dependent methyltransferase